MRVAKAPQEHVNTLRTWLKFNNELCKIDPTNQREWQELKIDWEDDSDFGKIISHCDDKNTFSFEYYMDYFERYISYIHMRIIFGYETLVENACDPDKDYLDYNHQIKQALEKQTNSK